MYLSSIFWHSAVGNYSYRGVTVNIAHTAGRLLFCIKSLALVGARRYETNKKIACSIVNFRPAAQSAVHDKTIARNGPLRPRNSARRFCRVPVTN